MQQLIESTIAKQTRELKAQGRSDSEVLVGQSNSPGDQVLLVAEDFEGHRAVVEAVLGQNLHRLDHLPLISSSIARHTIRITLRRRLSRLHVYPHGHDTLPETARPQSDVRVRTASSESVSLFCRPSRNDMQACEKRTVVRDGLLSWNRSPPSNKKSTSFSTAICMTSSNVLNESSLRSASFSHTPCVHTKACTRPLCTNSMSYYRGSICNGPAVAEVTAAADDAPFHRQQLRSMRSTGFRMGARLRGGLRIKENTRRMVGPRPTPGGCPSTP